MSRYEVTHETKYAYGAPVDLGQHLLRMTPLDRPLQKLIVHTLEMTPKPHNVGTFLDHFGNGVHYMAVEAPHDSFTVTLKATVEIKAPPWSEPPAGPAWEDVREAMREDGFPSPTDVAEFIEASPLAATDSAATDYARVSFPEKQPVVTGALDLIKRFRTDFEYSPGVTTISTPVAEVMSHRSGVCQDFAHAMISGLRGLGLPARYVSGYLRTGHALRGADASHAWVSLWCGDELGWLDFDPTNNVLCREDHITIACGRDFSDVTPMRGTILGGGRHNLSVAVHVEALSDEAAT
jgi:transglutaminase-like putative cysteine protease